MWQPWMGHLFHLRPADMMDMSLTQIIYLHDTKQMGE
jgi:hypothetical protein